MGDLLFHPFEWRFAWGLTAGGRAHLRKYGPAAGCAGLHDHFAGTALCNMRSALE